MASARLTGSSRAIQEAVPPSSNKQEEPFFNLFVVLQYWALRFGYTRWSAYLIYLDLRQDRDA